MDPSDFKPEVNTRTGVVAGDLAITDERYTMDFTYKTPAKDDFWGVHTTVDMMHHLDNNPKVELESRVLCQSSLGNGYKKFNSTKFREQFVRADKRWSRMRESFGNSDFQGFGQGPVGRDFIPLLGGPFYKNLYYYTDYINMHQECFYALHHDPIAKALINITRDFVMGTGYEIQTDTSDQAGKVAMATWKAFEKVNNLKAQMEELCVELATYGETMIWWLPNNQAKITFNLSQNDIDPKAIIPRVRLIDPSNIIEIVTYPEDITRKLFYVWLTPTQYQIYTSSMGSNQPGSDQVQPTLKYIYQQIPADQMMHFKVNSVSNEKRGRSDLFPVLSYLKRLRDSVNYAIISLQKVSAWSIDTTIDGNQADIDNYIRALQQLGTIPPAGSEHIHSKAITREYLGNSNASANMSNAFEWCLSMICAGEQIPVNYLGTHLSGGSTRASAIVATEPVAKKMEKRREVIKRILQELWDRLMKEANLGYQKCEIIFPEIITQDRSQKLKDLTLAETNQWISPQRAATMAAKEFGAVDYDYATEMQHYEEQKPEIPAALTGPPQQPSGFGSGGAMGAKGGQSNDMDQESAITGSERRDIKLNGSTL